MIESTAFTPLKKGIQTIKNYVKTLPNRPGVYRMLNAKQKVLYVGKALSLKKRVANYALPEKFPNRLQRMILETTAMEFVVTKSEVEALLLEANLIKYYDPPYNVRLKDDKFFAYIHLSDHFYPRLSKYRGDRKKGGHFFGPFVSVGAIDEALIMLQKTFKVRSCYDSYFKARKRPCLQYHIKRCSAPCVGKISSELYHENTQQVKAVLQGKTQDVQYSLKDQMLRESKSQHYERAAILRDQIKALTALQAHQSINIPTVRNADFFALATLENQVCIQGFFYRNGSNYGTHSFFIKEASQLPDTEIFSLFLAQFYADKESPAQIFTNISLNDLLLLKALEERAQHKIHLLTPQRGIKKEVLETVLSNATAALERDHLSRKNEQENLCKLSDVLSFSSPLERIEIYDNSHIQGTNAIGAMVVSGLKGFEKNHYRKFTIKSTDITPGDDFGMMREVLERRFKGSLVKDTKRSPLPDLVIIDGGKGQLSAAQEIFDKLDIDTPLLAIAKGPKRNAGKETFFTKKHPQGFKLDQHVGLLHYLQRLRDEAHRFAITFHRAKRTKAMKKSLLDSLPGVGAARKKALLQHFGSGIGVKAASIEDLQKIKGISKKLAKSIYSFLHSS